MKVGIHGKKFTAEAKEFIQRIFTSLEKTNYELFISESFVKKLKEGGILIASYSVYKEADRLHFLDFFLTLGGDGTLLEALTHIGSEGIPILGVNTGRLGFLATTSKEDFDDALTCLQNDQYSFDERILLQLESNDHYFKGFNFALNDFAILKKDTSSMIVVHAFLNGEFLNSYWADGVIVSTPTGSTGYSISCGGPVILPQTNNFLITPVSPHNLTMRPIVVPDDSEITFTVEGRSANFLISLDSRYETIDDSVSIKIKKADFKARLLKLENNSYFKTLRQKLNWGLDVRN